MNEFSGVELEMLGCFLMVLLAGNVISRVLLDRSDREEKVEPEPEPEFRAPHEVNLKWFG